MGIKHDPSQINILIVDDDQAFRETLGNRLRRKGYEVNLAGGGQDALELMETRFFSLALLDIKMPGMDGLEVLGKIKAEYPETEVIMMTGYGTIDSAVEAMRVGAYHYLTKPCNPKELDIILQRAVERHHLARRNTVLREGLRRRNGHQEILGGSPAIKELRNRIATVAPWDSTVLLLGETGTGKELAAHAIHHASPRADNPLIIVNAAALQSELMESELFGHSKGAFTGAVANKSGLFEIADKGTLFLDEVADLSPSAQASLLRVIETGQFRSVGSTREITVDVRLVAATNKDMEAEIANGNFRQDLYFRLTVVTIRIPPLRERGDDIKLLADAFFERLTPLIGESKTLTEEAMDLMERYDWPGNVRELHNVLEQAALFTPDQNITTSELPPSIIFAAESGGRPATLEKLLTLNEMERHHIEHALKITENNKTQAAKLLGINIRTLQRKLHQFSTEKDH